MPKIVYVGLYHDGLAVAKLDNGSWCYVDENKRRAFPGTYDMADPFSEGIASVQVNGKWYYINLRGGVAVPNLFQYAGPCKDGVIEVCRDGKFSHIRLYSPA